MNDLLTTLGVFTLWAFCMVLIGGLILGYIKDKNQTVIEDTHICTLSEDTMVFRCDRSKMPELGEEVIIMNKKDLNKWIESLEERLENE